MVKKVENFAPIPEKSIASHRPRLAVCFKHVIFTFLKERGELEEPPGLWIHHVKYFFKSTIWGKFFLNWFQGRVGYSHLEISKPDFRNRVRLT